MLLQDFIGLDIGLLDNTISKMSGKEQPDKLDSSDPPNPTPIEENECKEKKREKKKGKKSKSNLFANFLLEDKLNKENIKRKKIEESLSQAVPESEILSSNDEFPKSQLKPDVSLATPSKRQKIVEEEIKQTQSTQNHWMDSYPSNSLGSLTQSLQVRKHIYHNSILYL